MHEITCGMSYLHMQSIIHCDLKIQNILIGEQLVTKVRVCRTSQFESNLLQRFLCFQQVISSTLYIIGLTAKGMNVSLFIVSTPIEIIAVE